MHNCVPGVLFFSSAIHILYIYIDVCMYILDNMYIYIYMNVGVFVKFQVLMVVFVCLFVFLCIFGGGGLRAVTQTHRVEELSV